MPTFPAKTNYLSGDVLTAAQMVDIGNGLNDLLPDAKGSLTTVSAANTPAQLTAGANGETLVADSSASTGLRWQTASNGNFIINGAQEIWQRGTSFTTSGATYTADRWQGSRSGVAGMTVSRQATSDTTNLPNIQFCARAQRDSGNTSTSILYYASSLESEDTRPLQGQTVVFSFWARAGANYSATSNILNVNIAQGTGTNQNLFSGYTGQNQFASANITLTTTWQRFSVSGTVSSTATQLGVFFAYSPTGTAGANDYYEVTGMQLERGSVPTAFKRAGGTLAGELAACQRYYVRFTYGGTNMKAGVLTPWSTTQAEGLVNLPVSLRVRPTNMEWSGLQVDRPGSGTWAISDITVAGNSSLNQMTVNITGSATLPQTNMCFLTSTASTSYLAFIAEL